MTLTNHWCLSFFHVEFDALILICTHSCYPVQRILHVVIKWFPSLTGFSGTSDMFSIKLQFLCLREMSPRQVSGLAFTRLLTTTKCCSVSIKSFSYNYVIENPEILSFMFFFFFGNLLFYRHNFCFKVTMWDSCSCMRLGPQRLHIFWHSKYVGLLFCFTNMPDIDLGREVRVSADARKKATYAEELRRQMEEDKRNRQRYNAKNVSFCVTNCYCWEYPCNIM